jgi:hypothetical protein
LGADRFPRDNRLCVDRAPLWRVMDFLADATTGVCSAE